MVGGEHLHNHHLRTGITRRLAEEDRIAVCTRDIELRSRDVVIAFRSLGILVIREHELKRSRHIQRTSEFIIHAHPLILTGHEVLVFPRDRQRSRLIVRTFHLADIPIRLQVRQVADTQVGTYLLYLLVIPQGESVVITIREQYRLVLTRFQVVGTEVAAGETARTIMVIPVLRCHLSRYQQRCSSNKQRSNTLYVLVLQRMLRPVVDSHHSHTDPDTKGIERTHVCIVTFTRLIRRLVQINHDSQTGQQEQQHGDRERLPSFFFLLAVLYDALAALPYHTDDTQQERQHVIHIVSLVVAQFGRQLRLVTQHGIVDSRNTADPVTLRYITIRLQVVLTSCKVPHEVAPVHEVHLVTEEEAHILAKRRTITRLITSAVLIAHTMTMDIGPLFVGLYMVRIRRPHTRERHLKLLHILVGLLVTGTLIAIGLTVHMRSRCILRIATLHYGFADITLHLQLYRRVVRLSVQQRRVTILLTVQVVLQREDIIRRVLIHRCIRIRTNYQHRITRVSHQHHSDHQRERIQPTGINPVFTRQQHSNQHSRHAQTDPPLTKQESSARQGKRQCKRYYFAHL